VEISLSTVQELAPDQASLNAAKKLLSPSKWPLRGQSVAVNTIWGECQGSGANPYYTMADVVDHGYKCTCPSRKFPCKHVLALLWQFAEGANDFAQGEPPEYVHNWLGRRRKTTRNSADSVDAEKPVVKKDISLAQETTKPQLTKEEIEKKEAANARRAKQNKAKTDASIADGLSDFQQWVNDQLTTGITTFIKEVNIRSRQIAARLVDAKATNFASRIDELPSRILALDSEQQPEAVFKELGQLVLLSEAWHTNPDDVDVRRAVATSESRDQLFNNQDTQRISGIWETVGEKVESRKDGLIAHSRWLLQLDDKPRFALLSDYYPASAGKREVGFSTGNQIQGELVFYPSRFPMRAVISQHEVITPENRQHWNTQGSNIWQSYAHQLSLLPWSEYCPCLLGGGRIYMNSKKRFWWRSDDLTQSIPLTNQSLNPVLLGSDLKNAFVLLDGDRAELLSAQTISWGTIAC
jgi:hypothetical protein